MEVVKRGGRAAGRAEEWGGLEAVTYLVEINEIIDGGFKQYYIAPNETTFPSRQGN